MQNKHNISKIPKKCNCDLQFPMNGGNLVSQELSGIKSCPAKFTTIVFAFVYLCMSPVQNGCYSLLIYSL